MPQVAAPLRRLLPLSQTLASAPAPLLHLSRRLLSSCSPASFGRAASLRALAYRRRRHPEPRRGSSTLGKAPAKEEMDREVAFNRKRAEGKDGGKRGTMELKARRLNPVNTTCYVQVRASPTCGFPSPSAISLWIHYAYLAPLYLNRLVQISILVWGLFEERLDQSTRPCVQL